MSKDVRGIFFVGALSACLLLTGCAKPSKIYASDKKEGVYFALPQGWKKVTQQQLAVQESKSTASRAAERGAAVLWQEAYSPDNLVDAKSILSLATPSKPIVYVRVRSLLGDEINSVSYNSLRDLVVPLTSWVNGTTKAPVFDISNDEEAVDKGARGMHTVFQFEQLDGSSQTIDQTSLLSNDHTIIYVLIIRCSTSCYNKQRGALEKIASSFTVRGK